MTKPLLALMLLPIALSGCTQQQDPKSQESPQSMTEVAKGKPATALPERVLVVFQDQRGHHWFAGDDQGVFRYDQKQLLRYTTAEGLVSNNIIAIQEDHKGNLYFDTQEGVSRYDGATFETLPIIDPKSQQTGWEHNPNDLWFRKGWNSDGPYRFNGEALIKLTFPKPEQAFEFEANVPNAPFSPYGIYSIYKDLQGTLWFGTAALGVCRYDGKTLAWLYEEKMTNTPEGGSLGIRATLQDKNGHYWFTNTRHRYTIHPDPTERDNIAYLNIEKQPGVSGVDEEGNTVFPYYMSITEDKNGHLWMVTYNEGIWHYDGNTLTQHLIEVETQTALLFSIYRDNNDTLWIGSHNAGVWKHNGSTFERFVL